MMAKLSIKNDYISVIACIDTTTIYHIICHMVAILACVSMISLQILLVPQKRVLNSIRNKMFKRYNKQR